MGNIKESKGEQKVAELLRKNRINFQREISFKDLKGKKKILLRYDFGIFKNNQLMFLIEVDGEQHFQYVPYFHKTYSNFLRQLERDRQKNRYCLLHHIPLIRIPYWELDNLTIEKIFTEPSFLVDDMFFTDKLIKKGVKR